MTDRAEQRVIDDIDAYGWHVVCIGADEHGPSFDYTIGLMQTFRHPEIIVFGLDNSLMHQILTGMVTTIRRGGSFANPGQYADVLEGFSCVVRRVAQERHREFLGYAMWYCRHVGKIGSLEAVQLFWPDKADRFPWEPECNDAVKRLQPLLQEHGDRES